MSKSSPAEWALIGGLASGCFVGSEADSVADVQDTAGDCYGLQCPCEPGFDCEIDPYYAPDALCFTDAEMEAWPSGYPVPLNPQPDGTIAWETDDQIYEWRGDVQGATWPGQTAQVIEAWDGFVGFEGSYDGGWVTSEYPDPDWGHEYGAVTFGANEPWWRFRPEDTGIYLSRITWGNVAGGAATDFIVTEERDTGLSYHEVFVNIFADPAPGQVSERDATAVILTHEYQVFHPVVVGDIDGDGGDDLVSEYTSSVFFSPIEGSLWADEPDAVLDLEAAENLDNVTLTPYIDPAPPFDVDGDGRDELLAVGVAELDGERAVVQQVYSWEVGGLVARGRVVSTDELHIFGSGAPSLMQDLDGDGGMEYVLTVGVVEAGDTAGRYAWAVAPYSEGTQELDVSVVRLTNVVQDTTLLQIRQIPSIETVGGGSGLMVLGANALCGEETLAYSVIDFASMLGVGS
ncbi:hypothetical protein LBMAG42_21370 [Deltaproteobacteria bacterium]|nr:hypothetical protein LBMAG42_21370 [Deltaproteobacteria bacterium]